jgi:hypothetical protein
VGFIYTRIMNPTQAALEARLNALEGGCTTAIGIPGALAVASGQAAEVLGILTLCESGDHLVSSPSLYGGTYNLFHYTLPKLGIDVTFVDDPHDLAQWEAAIQDNTKLFFGETMPNPKNDVFDIEGISGVGHANGIPLMLDNTVPTPYLIRPFEWGCDIVVHSLTKFIGGHGTSIGGALIDGGTFDYGASGRFQNFIDPDPSYHGLAYWPALGHGSYILKARVQLLRDMGMSISPMNSFLFLQGLETLSLRMERHFENTERVAAHLDGHDQVLALRWAGLPSSPVRRRQGLRLGAGVRDRRWSRGGQAVRRWPEASQPRRQHRRRSQFGDPPRQHHPQPADARGTSPLRRHAGPRAIECRARVDRRHPRRHRPRVRRRSRLRGRGGPADDRRRPPTSFGPEGRMKLAVLPCVAVSVVLAGCGDGYGASPAASVPVGTSPVAAAITVSGGASGVSLATSGTSLAEPTVATASSPYEGSTVAPAYIDVDVDPGLGTDGFVGASDDVRLDRCELDGDHWVAAGMVTNSSGAGAAYRVYVAFNPPYSPTARGLVQVDLLIPDAQSQTWKAVAWITDPGLECVLRVERISG